MKTFIIAEAGVNHNGDMAIAKKLIDVAADAGADAVKFQTFQAELLVTEKAPQADYQTRNIGKKESQFAMLKRLELPRSWHSLLQAHAKDRGIIFLSTPFSEDDADFLESINVPFFKIPSGEITNIPYLRHIGAKKKKIIISTGMANMDEVRVAIAILVDAGTTKDQITVLHCHTDYPTAMEDVNLRAMLSIKDALGVRVGYSDHTLGIEISIAAAALGATVIEKHFTLDKNMEGPDHKASLDPSELHAMVRAIRNIEQALGDGIKKPTIREIKVASVARKSIVAARDIKANEIFSKENLTIKRPGTGISPTQWDKIVDTRAKKNFRKDECIDI